MVIFVLFTDKMLYYHYAVIVSRFNVISLFCDSVDRALLRRPTFIPVYLTNSTLYSRSPGLTVLTVNCLTVTESRLDFLFL